MPRIVLNDPDSTRLMRQPRLLTTPGCYVDPAPARISLGGRSSPRHQDLREGSALEALLFDDVQLQVLFQPGEWAVPGGDRDRDRRELVFVDEAQAGQRLGQIGAAVDQDRPFVVATLQIRDLRAQ